MSRLLVIALLAVSTEIAATLWRPAAAADAPRPNILLILADNWSWPHAGALGDPVLKTPAFDRLAREGTLFTHAFCPIPSCSPCRSCLLTGRAGHQLGAPASLWSDFSRELVTYPDLLRQAGYAVGYTAKGWSPGDYEISGRTENPAGPRYLPGKLDLPADALPGANLDESQFGGFRTFLDQRPADRPFCFWLGYTHPSRPTWIKEDWKRFDLDPAKVVIPECLPDVPEVRSALLDYFASIERLDALIARTLDLLESQRLLESTVIVCCGDNGFQMPRGLANVYDTGSRVPFVVRGPGYVKPGWIVSDFISLTDLAPTFLELGGVKPPEDMTGRSLLKLFAGEPDPREAVFLERERHANVREGNGSYPVRAIRTHDSLYIRNLRPDRWPAGDPVAWYAVGPYGDVDDSLAKQFVLSHKDDPQHRRYYDLSFAKRPAEELYDLRKDPGQVRNVATDPAYASMKSQLAARLDEWRRDTQDPRMTDDDDQFDRYPYLNPRPVEGARPEAIQASPFSTDK